MTRRSMVDPFEKLSRPTDTEQKDVTGKSNSITEQSKETDKHINETVQGSDSLTSNPVTETSFIQQFEEKAKKQTIEDTHTRGTFLIRNDLLERLEKLAKKKKRGFKTHLVNHAIERVLNEIENK